MWHRVFLAITTIYMSFSFSFYQKTLSSINFSRENEAETVMIEGTNINEVHHDFYTPILVAGNTSNRNVSSSMVDNISMEESRVLLDFLVAGFAKCGTTSLGVWLRSHPGIQTQRGEMQYHKYTLLEMVQSLASSSDEANKGLSVVKNGFRDPHYIQSYR